MAKRTRRPKLGPRRKRMSRAARLQSAVTWRRAGKGKHVVDAYARWFGVDPLCAIVELRMLGISVAAEYEQAVRQTLTERAEARAKHRARKLAAKLAAASTDGSIGWISTDVDFADEAVPY